MSSVKELLSVCVEMGIESNTLTKDESKGYLSKIIEKYNPEKMTGHLSIGGQSITIPLEEHEFTYSKNLKCQPLLVFFDQDGIDRKKVVRIENGQLLCDILENSFGMEYFISNEQVDYLIAVNWYAIEGVGAAKEWLGKLTK